MRFTELTAVVLLMLFMDPTAAFAYEQDTHKNLSTATVKSSVLASPEGNILNDLGLNTDIGLVTNSQTFPNSDGQDKTIIQLIEDGADFEDNLSITLPRPLHHFYDPINDQSLQHPLLNLAGGTHASPDWALEDTGQIAAQEYAYQDAMDAFYLALTSPTEAERNQQWGKVFEILGHVIHHIQDMAQPEHVRNDLHCGEFWGCGVPGAFFGIYDPSLFEDHSLEVFENGIPPQLVNYPTVSFPTAREFWTTRASDPVVTARRGLADFTNRNFVSKDTNFEIKNGTPAASSRYDLPVPSGTNIEDLATLDPRGAEICQALNRKGPIDLPPDSLCEVEFIENDVVDSYDPSKSGTNERAASLSLFDQYLSKYAVDEVLAGDGDTFHVMDVDRLVTINEYNIDAAHTFLIPRAVAYSAGLIDHFFRRIVRLEEGDQGLGWIIRNLTSETLSGEFGVYFDNGTSFNRSAVPNAIWTLSIGPNATQAVSFSRPVDESGAYMLVFRGSVGNEEEIVSAHYAIMPLFTLTDLAADVTESYPDVWQPPWCNWKSSYKVTRNLQYQVSYAWKGQEISRVTPAVTGDRLHETYDIFCETGGTGNIRTRSISTYTNWIEFANCPAGSNQIFCGNTVTNGVLQFDIPASSGDSVETDSRDIAPIDLGIANAMVEIIDEIRSAGF